MSAMKQNVVCLDDVCRPEDAPFAESSDHGQAQGTMDGQKADSSVPGPTSESAGAEEKNRAPKKASASNSLLKAVHTQQEMDALLSQHSAVVVEFVTSWCGACKSIQPLYEELASTHSESVKAAQVMCDKNRETKKLAAAHGVSAYPVFLLFSDGSSSGRWEGADRGKLEKAFEKLVDGGGGKKKKGGRSSRK